MYQVYYTAISQYYTLHIIYGHTVVAEWCTHAMAHAEGSVTVGPLSSYFIPFYDHYTQTMHTVMLKAY